jgi:hypothetical protein
MAEVVVHWFSFLVGIFGLVLTMYLYRRAKHGKSSYVRELPQIKAFDQSVARATEMGAPVFMAPGCKLITNARAGAATMASFNVVRYISKLCAEQKTPFVVGLVGGVNIPYVEDAISLACTLAGAPEQQQRQEVRYLAEAEELLPYAAMLQREKAGSSILFGDSGATTLVVLASGIHQGTMQIAGNAQIMNSCWLPPMCDYFFIGEEVLAVGAFLSGSKEERNTILGHDILKALLIAILLLGIIVRFGFGIKIDFLAM